VKHFQIQNKICEQAIALFLEQGFENVSLESVAHQLNIEIDLVYKYFGTKQDIILFFYQKINVEWEFYVTNLNDKKLSIRFEKALFKKIELISPYSSLIGSMMNLMLQSSSNLGIQSPRTKHIRLKGIRLMQNIIDGSDGKLLKSKVAKLSSMLYLIHWAVLFLHVQTNEKEKSLTTIKLISSMLKRADDLSFLLPFFPFFKDVASWANTLLNESTDSYSQINNQIINVLFNHRKVSHYDEKCEINNCKICNEKHFNKIDFFVSNQQPIHFILPAFPAKSPNISKVLGDLPDLGEEVALITLENLCNEIKDAYAPGARITICSDGRIFAKLVGVTDEKVSAYVNVLHNLINELELKNIDIINLEDILPDVSFNDAREYVIEKFAESIFDLQERLKKNDEFKNLFNGIHRFIVDDRMVVEANLSKTKIKEESKLIALQVIQYSNAWTNFLASYFPESIRLSIHPYTSHADKIGIKLTKAADNWLTPWHGVMVLNNDGYTLMKKNDAEKLNAKLVSKNNHPYYYSLI
jgi:pyoverdine/dityrosine biosynthesis protein Dit1